MLALGREIDAVVEITRYDVGAAADHSFEGFRTALEVDDLDIEAGLFVLAERLCQHGGQIAQARPATDRKGDLGLRKRDAARQHNGYKRRSEPSEHYGHDFLHCFSKALCRPIRPKR